MINCHMPAWSIEGYGMETFTEFRPMVVDPHYQDRRRQCLNELNSDELDPPIAGLIDDLCEFPFCFTIQSCFGHFLYPGQEDPNNIQSLSSPGKIHSVDYRIAYIAICVEDSRSGRKFLRWLKQFSDMDPHYVQYGCAEWFWERYRIHTFCRLSQKDTDKRTSARLIFRRHSALKRSETISMITSWRWFQISIKHSQEKIFRPAEKPCCMWRSDQNKPWGIEKGDTWYVNL